jgi:hypothetical protein
MSAQWTMAPWLARSRAVALPMPLPPPVMTAILPSNMPLSCQIPAFLEEG